LVGSIYQFNMPLLGSIEHLEVVALGQGLEEFDLRADVERADPTALHLVDGDRGVLLGDLAINSWK
jgi:hypothetical protein